MAKESRNHHFVPRSILKNFSILDKGKQVFVFDKLLNNGYTSSISDAGSENNFNTVSTTTQKLNFENIFDEPDANIAPIIKLIVDTNSLSNLAPTQLNELLDYVLVQYLRVKLRRSTSSYIQGRLHEVVKDLHPKAVLEEPIRSEEEIKFEALKIIEQRPNHQVFFSDKTLLLFKAHENSLLITSDNPIVKHNAFPHGGGGFNDKGIKIYFPISITLAIGIWCNSIFELWKQQKPYNLKPIEKFQNSKRAIPFSKKDVEFINSLQIMQSSRFIYSAEDQSNAIRQLLSKKPKYKEVLRDILVGKMGEGPTPKINMPIGEYLIVWVSNLHYMIQIEMKRIAPIISFHTKDVSQLELISKYERFDKAEVYRDGKLIRSIPNAIFEKIDLSGINANLIVYEDKIIEEFVKNIIYK